MKETRNALIEKTTLGPEGSDYRGFTLWLHLNYGGVCQGFGGYTFDKQGVQFIESVLRVVGVGSWEAVPGKMIRIESEDGKIIRIGHIIEDKWFNPATDIKWSRVL